MNTHQLYPFCVLLSSALDATSLFLYLYHALFKTSSQSHSWSSKTPNYAIYASHCWSPTSPDFPWTGFPASWSALALLRYWAEPAAAAHHAFHRAINRHQCDAACRRCLTSRPTGSVGIRCCCLCGMSAFLWALGSSSFREKFCGFRLWAFRSGRSSALSPGLAE